MYEPARTRFDRPIREAPSAGAWVAYCAPGGVTDARERLTGRPEHVIDVKASPALAGTRKVYLVSAVFLDRALHGGYSVPVEPGEIRVIPETGR